MGGKKRLTIKQMEKLQARKQGKKEGESTRFTAKKTASVFLPNPKSKKIVDELKKMKVLTPYTVASRLDLRLSTAKHFLKELARQGIIEYVSSGKNLKIYKIAD